MEDLPLRDLEQQVFQVRKKITNKLPEVAGDGLNLDFSKRNSWGKKWKTCIPRGVFFSVVQVHFSYPNAIMHEIFVSTFASFHGFNEGNLSHMEPLGYLCYVNTHSLNKVPNPIKVTSFEAVRKTKQNV